LNVSSVELDKMIKGAKDAKAYGAKLSGAGGGDCMIVLTDPRYNKDVIGGIVSAGGIWMNVKTGAEGVKIEK
ncbi:MAG: mevalonate kinase, partial [Microgenomates group bacterium]